MVFFFSSSSSKIFEFTIEFGKNDRVQASSSSQSWIPSIQRTNFFTFVTKVNKMAKLLDFLVTSHTKFLELYYDVTVKFSPTLKETFGQITAKQHNIKLELAAYSRSSGAARNFKRGAIISTFFLASFFCGRKNLKLIEKQEKLWEGPETCYSGKFLKFTCCNGYFSAF